MAHDGRDLSDPLPAHKARAEKAARTRKLRMDHRVRRYNEIVRRERRVPTPEEHAAIRAECAEIHSNY